MPNDNLSEARAALAKMKREHLKDKEDHDAFDMALNAYVQKLGISDAAMLEALSMTFQAGFLGAMSWINTKVETK